MEKLLRCDCGYGVQADDEAELVAQVGGATPEGHGMQLSPEDVTQLAFRAELGDATWQERLRNEAHQAS